MNDLRHSKDDRQNERPSLTTNKNISDILQRRHRCRHSESACGNSQEERIIMSQFITALSAGIIATVLGCGTALLPTPAAAAPDADKAAVKQATATCKAQVKEQAHFAEMSLYARHKLVKECVKETLAKPH